ncbi:MAG: hypothetical protein WDZ70_02310 [Candidatus Paceibacterota bacterium]
MTAWFYIFIFSLAGIIILLGTRLFEEKRGLPRFLVVIRKKLNKWLEESVNFIQTQISSFLERGGQSLTQKVQELREHPTLRRGAKFAITVIASVIHDIIVTLLRFLGKVRKYISKLHDRYSD